MKATTRKRTVLTSEQRKKALEAFIEKIKEGAIVPFAEKTNEARQNLAQSGLLQR